MDNNQRQRIINSQRDAFLRHGYHPHALLWSNQEIQELRFKILADIGIQAGDSVLDVGCGFGDFSAYLENQQKAVDYTGIDLSPELIQEGRKQYPNNNLVVGDLFEFNPADQSYDYVTLSGTLNRDLGDKGDYAQKTIQRMYAVCQKGVAFNLLDARHEWTANRWDLQAFLPEEIAEFVATFSQQSNIIDGYLDNDFTVYLLK